MANVTWDVATWHSVCLPDMTWQLDMGCGCLSWYMVHGYLYTAAWCGGLGLWDSLWLPDTVCAYLTWHKAT